MTKSFWVVKTRLALRDRAQLGEVADVGRGVGVMIGEDLQVVQPAAEGLQRPAESLGIADAAEGDELLARELGQRSTSVPPSRPGRAGRDARR